ncbi:MAG: hypothetical protein O3A95_03875 [Planctomycetota bacterium]|nr:hypothetical protein [Planctomycetota bacterium]MDA1113421.1 hypothetical protein [Planctomycetota bacterium]
MNSKQPSTKKRKRIPRKSGCLGQLFFLLIGLLLGGAGLHVYQNGFDQSLVEWKALFEQEKKPIERNPSTGGRVVDAVKMDLRPLYLQDERWAPTIEQGEQGVVLFELALHDHYEVKGDPFLFRSRMSDASGLMNEALATLRAMREEYEDKPNSVIEIDKKIRRYSSSLEEFGKDVR